MAPTRVEALRDDARLRIIMEAALLPSQHYDLGTFAAEGEAVRWLLAQSGFAF